MATFSGRYRPRERRVPSSMYFALLIGFGLLFTGCSSTAEQEPVPEFVSFTAEELEEAAKLRESMGEASSGSFATLPLLDGTTSSTKPAQRNPEYEAFFANTNPVFIVSNPTVNVRSKPDVQSSLLTTLKRGDTVDFIEFTDAAWAKIRLSDAREAYVNTRFLTRVVPDELLAKDKEQYAGLYFVDFDFINIRSAADTEAELLGTLPGQTIVKPLSLDDKWARILHNGREVYVAREYLTVFEPVYSVRQSTYTLPIISFDAAKDSAPKLQELIAALKARGTNFLVFEDVYNLLKEQQVRDVRMPLNTVILALTNITPDTLNTLSDLVYTENIKAVAFISTSTLGIDSITEKKLVNIQANGLEVQSAAHLGEDLRPLTSEQIRLEMDQSKLLIEELTRKPVRAIHYPFGQSNERIAELARDSGYLFGLTGSQGRAFNRSLLLSLPVISFDGALSTEQMTSKIDGA